MDGGHRAVKYTRLGGVSDEVYSEGTHLVVSLVLKESLDSLFFDREVLEADDCISSFTI